MKKLRIYILIGILFFMGSFSVHAEQLQLEDFPGAVAQENSGITEKIDHMDVQALINPDSSVSVVETIEYDFGDQNKHGIYRTIPLGFIAEGEPGHTAIDITGVTDEEGNAYYYTITSHDPINVKIGDPESEITGKHTYKISYTLKRSIGYFNTYDEWYWNLTGDKWEIPIQSVTATVILPGAVALTDLKLKDYCGTATSTSSCGTFVSQGAKVIIYTLNAQRTLAPGEEVTIAVGFPKGLVVAPTQSEFFLAWFLRVWFLPFPFLIAFLWFRKRFTYIWKRHIFFKNNTVIAEYDASDFGVLQAALLVNKDLSSKDISALIVWLAVHGYITIEDKDGEFCFRHTAKDPADLHPSERIVFQVLNGICESAFSTNEASQFSSALSQGNSPLIARDYIINNAGSYSHFNAAKKSIVGRVVLPLFLAVNPGIFMWILGGLFWGGIWLGFIWSGACVLIAIGNLILKSPSVYLTEKGFEAERKLLGLKLYIEVAEKDRIAFANAPAKTPELFEKLLPYAMVFGLEKKWAKEFEGLYTANPSWYTGTLHSFSSFAFINSLSSVRSSVDLAIVSSVASSRSSWSSSSGGSSGGGSSGGGGGGGGGGSW
jgi:hypothetical protein